MLSDVERLKAQRKLRKRQLRLKQVREQESAVARHQAVMVNRKLAQIKQEKAQLKAAALMQVAAGYSNQLNSALVQLGTAHESAFDVVEKQQVIIQRHVERQDYLAANAEHRGAEALKLAQQARARQEENRLQAEQKEAIRYHYMTNERKAAQKFAERALERQLVRDQYILPEDPVDWNVTRVYDASRRVAQGAESPADRKRTFAHARVIRHADVREDAAAVFNEATYSEEQTRRRFEQREYDRQQAVAAAEARGAQAQRKLDQDKDVLLVEEELTKLDALDRARRKVGRSENEMVLRKARAKASRDAQLAEKEFEAIFMREMPLAAPSPPAQQPEVRPDVPQWEAVDDHRARPTHQRSSSLASQSSVATTAVGGAPAWVELKPPRPRERPVGNSRRAEGIVPTTSNFEVQAEIEHSATPHSTRTASTLSPRMTELVDDDGDASSVSLHRPSWRQNRTTPIPEVAPLPQQQQSRVFATHPPATRPNYGSDAASHASLPSSSPASSPVSEEDEELRVSGEHIAHYLQQLPRLGHKSSSPSSTNEIESVHGYEEEITPSRSSQSRRSGDVLFGEAISPRRSSSNDSEAGQGSTERKSDEFSPTTHSTEYARSGSDTDLFLAESFRHVNDIATEFLRGAAESKHDDSMSSSASNESISAHLTTDRGRLDSSDSELGVHEMEHVPEQSVIQSTVAESEREGEMIDHLRLSSPSRPASQTGRDSSSRSSSVHSPKPGSTTPPFSRGAALPPRQQAAARTFWDTESDSNESASPIQLEAAARQPQDHRTIPRSTVVAEAQRAVQDIAMHIRALESGPGDDSTATSTKSSRYSVYIGGAAHEEQYASRHTFLEMYSSRSENRFGYYGENAVPNLQLHSYVSSDHSSVLSPRLALESESEELEPLQVDWHQAGEALGGQSLDSASGDDSPASSASTALARHGTRDLATSPDRPAAQSLQRDESRSPFSLLKHHQWDDSNDSSTSHSLSLTSLTQESLTMTRSQLSHHTEQYANVISLPSQSFVADAQASKEVEDDADDADSDFDLEEQSLDAATPPKAEATNSLSQHELTQSRTSTSFQSPSRQTNLSQMSLPYDPKWEELASMQKALADIQNRVARLPVTSPQTSDDSIESNAHSGQKFVPPSPVQTPTASESDLAMQSLRTPSDFKRSARGSTAPSSTTSELQYQALTSTPMASVLEHVTVSEMASVNEIDSIASASDDSSEKLQIFDGVVLRIREQLRGTASQIAHLQQQQPTSSDSDSTPDKLQRSIQDSEEDDEHGEFVHHEEDSLQQSLLQSDSLSEYLLPSESGRTDEGDNFVNTLTQTSYSTQHDLSQFPLSTPQPSRLDRSSSF